MFFDILKFPLFIKGIFWYFLVFVFFLFFYLIKQRSIYFCCPMTLGVKEDKQKRLDVPTLKVDSKVQILP